MNHRVQPRVIIVWPAIVMGLITLQIGCHNFDTPPNTSELPTTKTKTTEIVQQPPVNTLQKAVNYFPTPQLQDSIVIGLDADMSSGSARSGESIRRGLELAIHKINREGGLLGKQVELVVRDHRGNPDRGLGNLEAFSKIENLLGVFGGKHTPVAIRELPFIHQNRMLYFCPWAAGTPVVTNGYSPNHVFRVSVRDELAGGFLVRQAVNSGNSKIALVLEQTAWGRSNEKAMKQALMQAGLDPVAIEWFHWGHHSFSTQIERLAAANCDSILFVGNPLESVKLIEAVAAIPESQRPIVISHWGITGGEFYDLAHEHLDKVKLSFLQTFSFIEPKLPERVQELQQAYLETYADCNDAKDIICPVGTAHAYELMLMVAAAVQQANSIEHQSVITALEALRDYRGIIRDYPHPFPPHHHDALDESDFILARFGEDGAIIPVNHE